MVKPLRCIWLVGAVVLALGLWGCGGGASGPAAGVSASGRVAGNVFESGSPIADASDPITVSIDGTDLTATAAPDGSFVLENVPSGLRTLVARTSREAVSVVLAVEAGRETHTGDLVMRGGGAIAGVIRSSADSAVVAGARVVITEVVATDTATSMPRPVRTARTDAAGKYAVRGLPAGSYLVSVSRPGFQSASLVAEVIAGASAAGDVALAPDATTPAGTMAGVVRLALADGTTKPVAGALVRLGPTGDVTPARPMPASVMKQSGAPLEAYGPALARVPELYAYTDADGAYEIRSIPEGKYAAAAVRIGLSASRVEVAIKAGETLTQDFTLKLRALPRGTVSGTVTNASTGIPVAGAAVAVCRTAPEAPVVPGTDGGVIPALPPSIFADPDSTGAVTVTGADGTYTLKCPAGDLLVLVQANGYRLYTGKASVPADKAVTLDMALTPETAATVALTGVVLRPGSDGANTPVADALVIAARLQDPRMMVGGPLGRPDIAYRTRTGSDGTFRLDVTPGTYAVAAIYRTADGGWASRPEKVEVTAETTCKLLLSIRW